MLKGHQIDAHGSSGMDVRAYNQTALWRHFQGAIFSYPYPGLEALGYSVVPVRGTGPSGRPDDPGGCPALAYIELPEVAA
jgi:hypothetical protein